MKSAFSPTFSMNFFKLKKKPFKLVASHFQISQQCKILHKKRGQGDQVFKNIFMFHG
jgi:hypothetical protein